MKPFVQDLKPTRLICAAKLLEDFLEEFFHLNPISQVGLITTQNKRAELVKTDLNHLPTFVAESTISTVCFRDLDYLNLAVVVWY